MVGVQLVSKGKNNILYLIAVLITFIDMLSKIIINHLLLLGEKVTIIKGILDITYVRNTGAAWSIFENNTLFIIIITVIFLGGFVYYSFKNDFNKLETFGYGMVVGGAFGNLLDRIRLGYVIDFIDINIFGYDYPVFNIADIAIVVGVIILLVGMFRGEKSEVSRG
jgi:signal peptidase II